MKWLLLLIVLFHSLAAAGQSREVEQLFARGEEAFENGKLEEAKSYFTRCIQQDPDYADAYFARAKVREIQKDYPGALTDLNSGLEFKPDHPEMLFTRGFLQYENHRYAEAKDDFQKLLSLPPGETNVIFYHRAASVEGSHQLLTLQGTVRPLLCNYIGISETKLGHYTEAIVWLDSAIRLEPKSADFYVNRGIAKEGLGLSAEALNDYQKALTIQRDHPVALNNIAVLKRKGGSTSQDDLDLVIEKDSSMLNPYLERAQLRMEGGFYKGALEDYTAALQIDDRNPNIWLNRGLVKEKLNDLKGAFSDYTKAIDLDEAFVKAWANRGNVLIKQGRTTEAIEDYSVAITYQADNAIAYYNRSLAYHKLKQLDKACEDLKKAEQLGQKVEEKVRKSICVQ
jgi:tetratricopeptide (TPR) repeat protein